MKKTIITSTKARSLYTWDNCTRNILERVRGAVNGLIRNLAVHSTWGIPHSPLATNKHLLLTNDNQY